jgi:hypothetical protein
MTDQRLVTDEVERYLRRADTHVNVAHDDGAALAP